MEIDFVTGRNKKFQMYAILLKGNRVRDRLSRWQMLNAPVCPAVTSPEGRLIHSSTSQTCVMEDLADSKKVAPTGEPRSNLVVGSLSQNVCTQIMSETGQTERGFAMKAGWAKCIDNIHPCLQTGWLNVKLADKYNFLHLWWYTSSMYLCSIYHFKSLPLESEGGRTTVFSLQTGLSCTT